MSSIFLTRFLNVAYQVTEADRGAAVDRAMAVQATVNIMDDDSAEPGFGAFAREQLTRSMAENQTIITNNIIDPSNAPKTNTALANLRFVVVFPVKDFGAVYVDRLIRYGIIPRERIEKLNQVLHAIPRATADQFTEEQMLDMYYRLP
jgi:cell division protein ZapA (FtsZ GTPase activity inhibitor)